MGVSAWMYVWVWVYGGVCGCMEVCVSDVLQMGCGGVYRGVCM